MPTAAAALGLGEEVIRRLGRWQPGQVTEAYVRSTLAIVFKAQAQIAERVRAGGVDFMGEASELSKFARYLRLNGHAEEVVGEALGNLEHFGEASASDREECDAVRGGPEGADGTGSEEVEAFEPGVKEDLGPSYRDSDEGMPLALTGFVVSIVGRRKCRRLHHLARCGLIPGQDYREFEVHGESVAILAQAGRPPCLPSRWLRSSRRRHRRGFPSSC